MRILVGRNAMLNQRLYEAARELSLALKCPDQWPKDLLRKARNVEKRLTAKGTIDKTINGMSVPVAGEIAQELCGLAMALNTLESSRRQDGYVDLATSRSGRRARLDVSGASG